MSTAHDAHAQTGEHDAHEAFTGEPVNVLPADEPRTPGWLPLLGSALFTGAAVVFLTRASSSPADEKAADAPPAAAPAETAVARPAQPAAPARPRIEPVLPTPDQARRLEQVVRPQGNLRPQAPSPPQPAPPPARPH